uniref:Uncharacterized protein n=1 Tax=Arundo donax TaxID=35708 RepID=A0A0A9CMI7_ARUDO
MFQYLNKKRPSDRIKGL